MNNDQQFLLNFLLSTIYRKIVIPADYHGRVEAVKYMQEDDVSGLVDSLTDFAVDSASVNYGIETDNSKYTEILNKWLERINSGILGVPSGVDKLAEQYFRERWKWSSFPVLKMTEWEDAGNGLILPKKMFFVDGGSIYAKDKNQEENNLKLVNYDYYLGSGMNTPLNKNVIMTKPFGSWYSKYPTPFLVKRGVLHNWQVVRSIKNKQDEILERIIPYLLHIKKGTEALDIQKDETYDDDQLQKVIDDFETILNEYKQIDGKLKKMVRATNFDEELKHLIPDISTMFNTAIFEQTERNILSGLGFIDVIESVSSSRRESVLNPKGFMEEIKKGVKDFKQILKEVVYAIEDKNKSHIKYTSNKVRIISSPITGFMTDKFKEKIRQCWDRGKISNRTAVEVIAEVDFETEVRRREQEQKDGIDATMYANVIENRKGIGIDIRKDKYNFVNTDKKEKTPDAKKDPVEKMNFRASSREDIVLVGSPYKNIKELPESVRNNLDLDLQRTFLSVFNKAYDTYENDSLSFRTAWSVIKQISRKDKKGKWVRRKKRVKGKLEPVKLTKAMVEQAIEKSEESEITEAFDMRKLELTEDKKNLIKKLNKKD